MITDEKKCEEDNCSHSSHISVQYETQTNVMYTFHRRKLVRISCRGSTIQHCRNFSPKHTKGQHGSHLLPIFVCLADELKLNDLNNKKAELPSP